MLRSGFLEDYGKGSLWSSEPWYTPDPETPEQPQCHLLPFGTWHLFSASERTSMEVIGGPGPGQPQKAVK